MGISKKVCLVFILSSRVLGKRLFIVVTTTDYQDEFERGSPKQILACAELTDREADF